MRNAFFALLFVNLAFMAWAGWVDSPKPEKTSDTTSHLPRLKLVGELSPDAQPNPGGGPVRKMALTTASNSSAVLQGAAAPARCVSVGPFNDLAIAAKASGALHNRGFTPLQRTADGEVWGGFWVYIGSVADTGTADKVFKTLEQAGIKDAHLMPGSTDGRRISVGLFSERERAERRASSIEKLGLKAEIEPRKHPGTVYWVDLTLKPSDGAVPVKDLLVANAGGSKLSVQACPTIPSVAPSSSPELAPAELPQPGSHVPPNTVAGDPKLR